MKRRHRVPVERLRLTEPVTPEYQAEVDRTLAKAERLYREAGARLARAEADAERATAKARVTDDRRAKRIEAEAWALVELRREELAKYERLMAASPQGAAHRGTKSFRPIPATP